MVKHIRVTQKMKDRFDFIKGQVVKIGYKQPAGTYINCVDVVVTKVHEKDINEHKAYDFIFFVGDSEEVASTITSKNRYLWRFIAGNEEPSEDFVNFLYMEKKYEHPRDDFKLPDNLFYLKKDNTVQLIQGPKKEKKC